MLAISPRLSARCPEFPPESPLAPRSLAALHLPAPPVSGRERAVFRTMKDDGDGPKVADRHLGVRDKDIATDPVGDVHPRTGGMSVALDSPFNLLLDSRPREFGGTGSTPIWTTSRSVFSAPITLRVTRDDHGQVEPRHVMPLSTFREALAATRPSWTKVRPSGGRS